MVLEMSFNEEEELTEEELEQLAWRDSYEVACEVQGHLPAPGSVLSSLIQIYFEAEDEEEEQAEVGGNGLTKVECLRSRANEIDELLDLYNLVAMDLDGMSMEQLDAWVEAGRPIARAGADRAGVIPLPGVLAD